MKKNLLIFVCLLIMTFTVSAQDTLKVNFKTAGSPSEVGWDSILVSDKVLYVSGYTNFNAFSGTVSVAPVWLSNPEAANVRAVNRTNDRYTGPLSNILRNYIAVDSRYTNDCNVIGIDITGLPAGTYTLKSFHHDFQDQYGTFRITTSVNSSEVDANINGMMISHSLSLDVFNTTYPSEMVPDIQANDYQNHYVTSSLDSVTQYTFNKIVTTGKSDVVAVRFRNVLFPSGDMDHHVKFVLINGFMLYKSPATGIENKQSAQESINIAYETGGNVSITGEGISEVIIFSINGIMIEHIANVSNKAELTNLQKGVYIAKVGFKNGKTISKKLVVH